MGLPPRCRPERGSKVHVRLHRHPALAYAWAATPSPSPEHARRRASTCTRDHSLSAAAARVLRLEAPAAASATYLWNSLLGLLCSRGGGPGPPHLARRVFDAMPQRDAVSYNTLIACLSRAGRGHMERARAYSRMLREDGVRPSGTTLSGLLALGGGDTASRGFVRQVNAHAVRLGLCSNAFVGSALVRAY